MSIHFISGKPGGGKTLYSVRLIVDELVNGSRTIITNVPIKIGRLNEYLQQTYPKAYQKQFLTDPPVHIIDRVILIDEEQISTFFAIRPKCVRIATVTNEEWKSGVRPDFSICRDEGVLYVLDEVHIAFNARAWASTGHEVLYYLSQHRKLGDDVICITQAISNVDKQFRSVAQDFTYIKNLSKQNVGLFRLPAMFTRNTYAQPATDNQKPMETGTFSLDTSGLASLYDTAKGVGIHGRSGADTNARKKGFHWLWFLVAFPLILWGIFQYLPVILNKVTASNPSVQQIKPHKNELPPQQQNNSSPSDIDPLRSHSENDSIHSQLARRTEKQGPEVTCTGYFILRDKPTVFLSDGRTVYADDVGRITRNSVICYGETFRISVPHALTPATPVNVLPSYSQPPDPGELRSKPVNEAIILPTIHARNYGTLPPARLNGIASMNHSLQPDQPLQRSQGSIP